MFLMHHYIYDPDHVKSVNCYRRPLQKEAAQWFQVSEKTVSGWFRRQARSIFADQNPDFPHIFTFSNGWWIGFRRWHNIVRRRITKQSTRRPEEYQKITNCFLKFLRRVANNRKNQQPRRHKYPQMEINYILNSPVRRFEERYTLNVDKTPIPFEYLDGAIWELLGAKTVAGKTDRSGWSKRQATLVLYIYLW